MRFYTDLHKNDVSKVYSNSQRGKVCTALTFLYLNSEEVGTVLSPSKKIRKGGADYNNILREVSKIIIFLLGFCFFVSLDSWGEVSSLGKDQRSADGQAVLSQEDRNIIQQLSLLENLDYLENEDIDFLQEYDQVGEIDEDGKKVRE